MEEKPPRSTLAILLPEKKPADSLIGTYWQYSHQIFPVLHRLRFMQKYDIIWIPTESFSLSKYTGNDLLLLAMINVVLAIGRHSFEHCPANWRKRDAESLYKRSVRLISAETLDSYSFEVVQLFLLRRVDYGLGQHSVEQGSMTPLTEYIGTKHAR
ncbi:hypothetical protein V8C37DRAFT_416237 [Trichoderma ceciliae]